MVGWIDGERGERERAPVAWTGEQWIPHPLFCSNRRRRLASAPRSLPLLLQESGRPAAAARFWAWYFHDRVSPLSHPVLSSAVGEKDPCLRLSSVVTAVTSQNTDRVQGVHPVPEFVEESNLSSRSSKVFIELRGQRIHTQNTHGTGCTLASCIAAELAKGATMLHAVQAAKKFLESALYHSKDIVIGKGPQGPFDHLFRLKSPLCEICRSSGVPLLINDRVDVALSCNVDGVHVGQSDMPVWEVRELLGPGRIIGVSCKTPAQAEQAWKDGTDYIGSEAFFQRQRRRIL